MAWNKSEEGRGKSGERRGESGERRGGRGNVHLKGLFAGAAVVLGAAAVVWWLRPTGESGGETPPPQSAGRIKAVEPAAAPKPVEVPAKPMTEAERIFAETNGMSAGRLRQWEFKNWKGRVLTNGAHRVKSLHERVFRNGADRLIAGLLTIEPGKMILGDSKMLFNRRFLEKFKKSLTEPIIPAHDDPENVRELKRAVNEAKIELKARMDGGEDICKILADTRDQMRELGLYRQELDALVKKQIKDGNLSDEDAQDCVAAANKMLADRGAKPIQLPGLYAKRLKLQQKKSGDGISTKGDKRDEGK